MVHVDAVICLFVCVGRSERGGIRWNILCEKDGVSGIA